jgi:MSHA biogenesis protein MshO
MYIKANLKRERGFTLIEAIMVIVITGILSAMVAVFIVAPVQGYADTVRRAKMTDEADITVRFISRELHSALPNSISCTSPASDSGTLSFLPINSGGRYREGGTGNPLQFDTSITQFDAIGGSGDATLKDAHGQTLPATGTAVIGNLGSSVSNCDATTAPQNTVSVTSLGGGGTITISSDTVPVACNLQTATASSPNDRIPGRFYMTDTTPVSYVCGPYGGNSGLKRNSKALSRIVSSCQIRCTGVLATVQTISLSLTLSDSGESMNIFRQVHVENYP